MTPLLRLYQLFRRLPTTSVNTIPPASTPSVCFPQSMSPQRRPHYFVNIFYHRSWLLSSEAPNPGNKKWAAFSATRQYRYRTIHSAHKCSLKTRHHQAPQGLPMGDFYPCPAGHSSRPSEPQYHARRLNVSCETSRLSCIEVAEELKNRLVREK